jgi:nucleoside-diphosphate-sugar epimerase
MPTLLCLGFGYCAEHFVALFGRNYDRIFGTVRGVQRAAILNAYDGGRLRVIVFDGTRPTPELISAIAQANDVLVSVPPDVNGDRVLSACGDAFGQAHGLRAIVYLSTIGVYGDHHGAWVDEQTATKPASARGRERVAAEQAWQEFGSRQCIAVAILRLAGIYGPGRNALMQIASGKARRVVKPGQIFNRIHVADIAQAIDAALARTASGIFNLADDEPTPAGDPLVFAAQLMGREPPPEIPFADAAASMSPMALSFWRDCRRVHNDKLKRELGIKLRYPTYRDGLRALFEEIS